MTASLGELFEVCNRKKGRIKTIEWLQKTVGCRWTNACQGAAKKGRIDVMKWAHDQGYKFQREKVAIAATETGQFLSWMGTQGWGIKRDDMPCSHAVISGNIELVQWIVSTHPWNGQCWYLAAMHGHVHILEWAYIQPGTTWRRDKVLMSMAADCGSLETLIWLRQHTCLWSANDCFYAALHGRLDIFRWARAYGCPWDKRVPTEALCNGHSKVPGWALENG